MHNIHALLYLGATVSFGQQTYSVVEGNSLSVTVGYSGTKAAGVSCTVTVTSTQGTATGICLSV